MVEGYTCCASQLIMVPSVTGPRICRDGAFGLSNVHRGRPALGGSLSANELHLGRRISILGVVGCTNFAPSRVLRPAMGFGISLETVRKPLDSSRRVKAQSKLENDREKAVSISKEEELEKKKNKKQSADKKEGLVERIEAELERQFGGALWFGVLLFCLAVFGGGYVYLIVNYADLTDIPILRGPQR